MKSNSRYIVVDVRHHWQWCPTLLNRLLQSLFETKLRELLLHMVKPFIVLIQLNLLVYSEQSSIINLKSKYLPLIRAWCTAPHYVFDYNTEQVEFIKKNHWTFPKLCSALQYTLAAGNNSAPLVNNIKYSQNLSTNNILHIIKYTTGTTQLMRLSTGPDKRILWVLGP